MPTSSQIGRRPLPATSPAPRGHQNVSVRSQAPSSTRWQKSPIGTPNQRRCTRRLPQPPSMTAVIAPIGSSSESMIHSASTASAREGTTAPASTKR
ncbi:MAG: hypothetical protein OXP08_06550 [bacterium]|nr:hypothetical protein [bacterium]